LARFVSYILPLWNYAFHGFETDESYRIVDHYKRVAEKDFPVGRTLYELWVTGDLKAAFSSEGVTMEETEHNEAVLDSLNGGVATLDFLGFDMTMQGVGADDPALSVALPVLEKGRLLKAIVFDKSVQKKKNMEEYDKTLLTAAIGVSKCTSLMLAGGWVYPDIRRDL
jgi:hypothetical protein